MTTELEIEYLRLGTLKPYPRNARTHSRKQIRQIADSIAQFGFTNPILIDGDAMILAGHGRVEAARVLGMERVPCVRLDTMTPAQKRAYVIADNKLALNAGWDEELLGEELEALLLEDKGIDLSLTGFTIAETDGLIEGLAVEEPASPKDEALPPVVDGPAVTRPGDVWVLGRHRLVCGDSLSPEVVATLMAGEQAQMVFTDPPYNVAIDGNVSGLGKVRHREFAMASGEMTSDQFTGFLEKAFCNLAGHSEDGAIHFVCMDWRHMSEMLEAGQHVYTELKNLIVWDKGTGGMGTFYRSRHELIFAFKKGTTSHINTFELGQHGRYRTNVWSYRGMNSFGAGRNDDILLHPTVKPVAMIADAIKDVSRRNGIVLDLFGGSGSTLIAAHKTGRRAYLCELDPLYCDRIIRRWQIYARDDAILEKTGQVFDEVAEDRKGDHMPIRPEQERSDDREPDTAPDDVGHPSPDPDDADLLVCWLPPFHPVSRTTERTADAAPQAAE